MISAAIFNTDLVENIKYFKDAPVFAGNVTYSTLIKSTTALATPAALTATQATAFASTVSGSAIMGFGTTNDVSLMNRAGTVVLGIGPNTTTVNMTGLLTVAGFGTHSFSAGGTGGNTFELRNTTAGTGNYTRLNLGNDNDQFSSIWQVYSSTYTSSGFAQASGTLLYANGSGGMSFGAFHASGAIRFYSGGTTLRGTITADGVIDWTQKIQTNSGNISMEASGFQMTTWSTTASPANANLANANFIKLVTSLRANKYDIESISFDDAHRTVMGLRAVTYRSKVDDDKRRWAGFIADEAEQVNPVLAVYGPDGKLQSFTYDRVPSYLLPVVQQHDATITQLAARIAALESQDN